LPLVFKIRFVRLIWRLIIDANESSQLSKYLFLNGLSNDLLLQLSGVDQLDKVDVVLLLTTIEDILKGAKAFEVDEGVYEG
jgi:hypothetical protein